MFGKLPCEGSGHVRKHLQPAGNRAKQAGGAIRGAVRGDVFWGHGEAAEAIAGRMKHPGRYWLLLPKPVAAALAATS